MVADKSASSRPGAEDYRGRAEGGIEQGAEKLMDLLAIVGKAVLNQTFLLRVTPKLDAGEGLSNADAKYLLDMLLEERAAPEEAKLSEACRLLAEVHTRTSMRNGDEFHIVDRASVIGVNWISLKDYIEAWRTIRHIARI